MLTFRSVSFTAVTWVAKKPHVSRRRVMALFPRNDVSYVKPTNGGIMEITDLAYRTAA